MVNGELLSEYSTTATFYSRLTNNRDAIIACPAMRTARRRKTDVAGRLSLKRTKRHSSLRGTRAESNGETMA